MSLVPLPAALPPFLEPYMPQSRPGRPFVTATWAQSLDARIAARPGVQTRISHPETKAMTHYLRSRHAAILVGVGTVTADDPRLNCRFPGARSPVPVVLDPHARWDYSGSQLRRLCDAGEGRPPLIVVDESAALNGDAEAVLAQQGGKYLRLALGDRSWDVVLAGLHREGVDSVMVEGGAGVLDELLARPNLVDAVVITIGPVFLGRDGLGVAPVTPGALHDVAWWSGAQDAVVCGRLSH